MSERRVSFIISANTSQWSKGLKRAERQMDRFGRNVQNVGRKMSRYLTVPAAAAAGASVKMAADFETSLSKIEGLVGVARNEIQGMRGDVLALAGDTARSPQELADALFFVTSAGIRGAEAMEVLEMSAKAATAGLGETKDIADLVTSAMNAYGAENLSAAKATDILTATVREGKAEADALAQSMGQVLPLASEMGVTFDQVGAAVAAMTRTGTDAATASTQLRQILSGLIKPAQGAENALKTMGTSSSELRKTLREDGLIAVLGFLREQMEDNEQAMSQVFPNIRALSGALDIMGSNAESNIGIFERMRDTTGSLDKAFEAAARTFNFKFNQAVESAKAVAVEFGTILLPMVGDIIEKFSAYAKAIQNLSVENKKQMLKIVAAVALVPPAIFAIGTAIRVTAKTIGLFGGVLKILSTTAKTVGAVFAITGAQIKAFGTAIVATSKKALLFAAGLLKVIAIAGLIAAVFAGVVVAGQYLFDNWEKIKQGMVNIGRAIGIAFQKMAKVSLTAIKELAEFIINSNLIGLISKAFGVDLGGLATSAVGIDKAIANIESSIEDGEKKLSKGIQSYRDLEWGTIGESVENAMQNAATTFQQQYARHLFPAVFAVKSKMSELLSGFMDASGIESIMSLFDEISEGAKESKSAVERLTEQMDRFGLSFVETTTKQVKSAVDVLADQMRFFGNLTSETTENAKKNWQGFTEELANNLVPTISNALGEAAGSFIEMSTIALTSGKSLKGVFNQVFQTLAELAIRVGKIAIGVGIAIEGIKKALQSLNPVAAIAAGVGLIALGAWAKSALSNAADGGGNVTSVNDALIKSNGDVIKFHPNDNLLAMKDFSQLGGMSSGMQGIQLSGDFRIKGTDLVLSLEKATQRIKR